MYIKGSALSIGSFWQRQCYSLHTITHGACCEYDAEKEDWVISVSKL